MDAAKPFRKRDWNSYSADRGRVPDKRGTKAQRAKQSQDTGLVEPACKLLRYTAHALACYIGLLAVSAASAHPHVFVDGGVNFIMGAENTLEAVHVTWRYDAFETLYMLSSFGMSLNSEGELDEEDLQKVVRLLSDWPDDFDGSAHLKISGTPVTLKWPEDVDAYLVDGRLEMTFLRQLETPLNLTRHALEVAFYESTYFFAFSITEAPDVRGPAQCTPTVIPFVPDAQDQDLQTVLAKLSREETSGIENVGAVFADRIILECA